MLSITLLCVGKMRETYYTSAFAEYAKRLGAYCRFELAELPEQRLPERPSPKEIRAALEKEAQAIRARIPKGAAVIAMCVEGKLLSSEALARQLAGYAAGGTSKVCFLVGGSFGLDEELKRDVADDVSAPSGARHARRADLPRVHDQRGHAISQIGT